MKIRKIILAGFVLSLLMQPTVVHATVLLPGFDGRLVDHAVLDGFDGWAIRLRVSCSVVRLIPFPHREKCAPDRRLVLPVTEQGLFRIPAMAYMDGSQERRRYRLSVSVERRGQGRPEVLLPLTFEGKQIDDAPRVLRVLSIYRLGAQPIRVTLSGGERAMAALRPRFLAFAVLVDALGVGESGAIAYRLHGRNAAMGTLPRLLVAPGDLGPTPLVQYRSRLLVVSAGVDERRSTEPRPFDGRIPDEVLRFDLVAPSTAPRHR